VTVLPPTSDIIDAIRVADVFLTQRSTSAFFAAAATPFVSLYVGSTGSQVKSLQGFLIKQGFLNISTSTTQFGPLTEAALRAFQKAKGLSQTGILDQATFAAMNGK